MTEFKPGLEGVVAFETEIAEPDRDGGALRYRGVDIEDLVGTVPFEKVWGLLVDNEPEPGLVPVEPYVAPDLTGNAPSDLQAGTAGLSGVWGLGQLTDISDDEAHSDLARLSATMISISRFPGVATLRVNSGPTRISTGVEWAFPSLLRMPASVLYRSI